MGRGEDETTKGAIILAFHRVVMMEVLGRRDREKRKQGDDGKV
jgi:hypothetical protein